MNKQRGLGRGLGALLSSTPDDISAVADKDSLTEIPISDISVNPYQPRKIFDPKALQELSASIKASGVIQPIVVRRVGGAYQLVAGERRWRAAREAGLTRIPAVVRDVTDAESLEIALVENLLREDLNPIEEAEAYQKLLAQFGWTQEALAQRVGRDRSSIANTLRLLRLPDSIQADLRGGRLTMGHALALLSLTSEADQLRLRDEILTHSWSVRAAEQTARVVEAAAGAPRRLKAVRRRSAELVAVEEALQRALMTRVRIAGTERAGTIQIAYANAEDLERLAELMGARTH
ncbi:MAG TPA: ParB/RepB/Spo0J family partition protein [Methylomirabilota bacterium]|nr:ParB/RepB/Spo0J family partition protein [Methylomirabilota bacterium]